MAKPEKQLYEFTEDRWFMNTFYKKGFKARFYPEQVKYEAHSIVPATTAPSQG